VLPLTCEEALERVKEKVRLEEFPDRNNNLYTKLRLYLKLENVETGSDYHLRIDFNLRCEKDRNVLSITSICLLATDTRAVSIPEGENNPRLWLIDFAHSHDKKFRVYDPVTERYIEYSKGHCHRCGNEDNNHDCYPHWSELVFHHENLRDWLSPHIEYLRESFTLILRDSFYDEAVRLIKNWIFRLVGITQLPLLDLLREDSHE